MANTLSAQSAANNLLAAGYWEHDAFGVAVTSFGQMTFGMTPFGRFYMAAGNFYAGINSIIANPGD